ncbi:uncharacterized protein LOC115326025 [Ixodes scapularis]|uniref:uncharacterized protein LOC115326025 n=1 Tax=Ixodes scapularis TaxID=6945 RepID=UPI001A9D7EE0|nr:uncharacterized protein LOC115326025 [Ixodes scapularis]
MKVDCRVLILASTIFLGVSDPEIASGDATTEDPFWTNVCTKAVRHYMGITMVVDSSFHKEECDSGFNRLLYLETFVQTVNLYFTDLRCSNVKLVLIKVVNLTTEVESKFERFKNTTESRGRSLDAHLTLALFREWANNQSFFNNSDVVYLLTSNPVFDFVKAYRLEMKAASYAYGVCSKRRVALGSDDGKTFSGVPAAVQQIANLLGFKWDDKRDREGCTPDDGHVMSRNGERTQYPTFSKCTKTSWEFRTQTRMGQSQCYMLNMSLAVNASKKTPYTFFNCTEPCKEITQGSGNNALFVPAARNERSNTMDICKTSCCPDYVKQLNNTSEGAPDGMPCGPHQVCLQQVCVKAPWQHSEVSTVATS